VARAVIVNVHSAAIVLVAIVLVAIVLVDMSRPKPVIVVGEAMCGTGAVTEGKSSGGGQYTKHVKQGDCARHAEPCCPGQRNEHQPLPSTPGTVVRANHARYIL
jgi:hypothetical protein